MSKKSESDAALIDDNRRLATDCQRIAEDGFWYTLGEFREWYGENASTKWVEAINRTREHQAPPPKSWYNAEEKPPPPLPTLDYHERAGQPFMKGMSKGKKMSNPTATAAARATATATAVGTTTATEGTAMATAAPTAMATSPVTTRIVNSSAVTTNVTFQRQCYTA